MKRIARFPSIPRIRIRARAPHFRAALLPLLWALGHAALSADPAPGDVFREYRWRPKGAFERMTAPDAKAEGAKKHLPNAINEIVLRNLEGASRIEAQIELLQSHAGTVGQALRLNGGDWIAIPPSTRIPGEAGTEKTMPQRWLSMRYPTIEIPLRSVKQGPNTFELTCRPGVDLGAGWPQSIFYGVTFRIYYPTGKNAPSGRVVASTTPRERGVIPLSAEAQAAVGRTVRRVDFIARYEGYDWRGEGVGRDYHFHTRYGEIQRHAGSAFLAPWNVDWDARWVPAQREPVEVIARIEDDDGLCIITAPAVLENFRGMANVRMYAAHAIPPRWQTRAGRRHSCLVTLPENLAGLREAKVVLASWNGHGADAIGVNDTVLVSNIGRNHGLSYDELTVPISSLRPGDNTFFTASARTDHGIEVLWPAFTVLARFESEKSVP